MSWHKISDRPALFLVVLSIQFALCQKSSKNVLISDTPISGEICYRILTRFSNSDTPSEMLRGTKTLYAGNWFEQRFWCSWIHVNSHYTRKIYHSGPGKLIQELLSLSFRHPALWWKHPALFHLSTRDVACLPRSSPSSRSKSSSKPFYFLSCVKFPIMKVNKFDKMFSDLSIFWQRQEIQIRILLSGQPSVFC